MHSAAIAVITQAIDQRIQAPLSGMDRTHVEASSEFSSDDFVITSFVSGPGSHPAHIDHGGGMFAPFDRAITPNTVTGPASLIALT
jgi:hypothetical protein